MFERATRLKLRFATGKGLATIEDLWDIPLLDKSGVSLDEIARRLNRDVSMAREESFVIKRTNNDDILELKFSIVKHIIKVKLDDVERKENAAANKAKKDKLMGIIAAKEEEGLKEKSLPDLKKMIEEL